MSDASKESVYFLSQDEIEKIILYAPSLRDRVVIKILANSGIRRAELAALEIKDVDFQRERIHVMHGKGDKQRTVYVDADTLQDIRFLIGQRTSGKIITSNKQEGISLKQINEICAKCGRLAGVRHPNPAKTDITPHLFRHSFTRNMLGQRMPMEQVQNMLGHSSIRTTMDVYGTPDTDSVQESYKKAMSALKKKKLAVKEKEEPPEPTRIDQYQN